MTPISRREGVLTHEVDGELVIYDQENDTAHRLSSMAAKVWQNCDGRRSVDDLAQLLGEDEATDSAAVVQHALGELGRANLLADGAGVATLTRRTAMRRMAQVAGAVMVTSIVAPTPAAALSGGKGPGKRKVPKTPAPPMGPHPSVPQPPVKGK
jgi:hypothetical protein